MSIKPYAVATGALLADAPYYGSAGGGLTLHASVGDIAFDPYVEIVQQSYRSSNLYPLASDLSGMLATYALQAAGPITTGLVWVSRIAYDHPAISSVRPAMTISRPTSGCRVISLSESTAGPGQ